MSSRLLIPKNMGIYFLYFIVSVAILALILRFYYIPPILADIPEESLGWLDIARPGSIFQWFVSILWLLTGVFSLAMAIICGSSRNSALKSAFWFSVGVPSLVMSADTVCGFLPFLRQFMGQKINEISPSELTASITFWILGVMAFFLTVTIFCFIHRYIRSTPSGTRLVLKGGFAMTVALFVMTTAFRFLIPVDGTVVNQLPESLSSDRQTARKFESKSVVPKADPRPAESDHPEESSGSSGESEDIQNGEEPEENDDLSDKFRFVSLSRPVEEESGNVGETPKTDATDSDEVGDVTEESGEEEKGEGSGENVGRDDSSNLQNEKTEATTESRPESSFRSDASLTDVSVSANSTEKDDESDQKTETEKKSGVSNVKPTAASLSDSSTSSEWSKESGQLRRFEDLFGWEKTVEENIGISVKFEEIFGFDAPLESILFGESPSLDAVRTREAVRRGTYALFLIFLSSGLALLGRAERIAYDKRIFGRITALNVRDQSLDDDL